MLAYSHQYIDRNCIEILGFFFLRMKFWVKSTKLYTYTYTDIHKKKCGFQYYTTCKSNNLLAFWVFVNAEILIILCEFQNIIKCVTVVQYRTRPAKLICDIVAGLILSPNFQTRQSNTTNPSPLPKEKAEKETEEKAKKLQLKSSLIGIN